MCALLTLDATLPLHAGAGYAFGPKVNEARGVVWDSLCEYARMEFK